MGITSLLPFRTSVPLKGIVSYTLTFKYFQTAMFNKLLLKTKINNLQSVLLFVIINIRPMYKNAK